MIITFASPKPHGLLVLKTFQCVTNDNAYKKEDDSLCYYNVCCTPIKTKSVMMKRKDPYNIFFDDLKQRLTTIEHRFDEQLDPKMNVLQYDEENTERKIASEGRIAMAIVRSILRLSK